MPNGNRPGRGHMVGSTEFIRKKVNSAPPGSKWGIGTEVSLANRIAIKN